MQRNSILKNKSPFRRAALLELKLMSLYETGTITGALNSTTITGAGTKWSDAKLGITNGSVLFISSNAGVDGVYQVKRVISDTSIELAQPIYKTFTNSKYSILVAESASTAAWSNQLAATLGYYQAQMDGWQQIMTGTGDVALTAPDGTKVTIKSFTKLSNDLDKKANSADLATLNNQVVKITGNQSISGEKNFTGTAKVTADDPQITLWSTRSSTPNGTHGRVVTFGSEGNKSFFAARAWEEGANTYVQYLPPFKDGYFTLWSTSNTTTDSSGFIKAASPIVKLYSDGRIETNSESEGVISERESVGVYRISVLGMNSDGAWGGIDGGFEVPTDRNGQRLLWLDYEVEADGSILVKTYHRTYPDAPAFARNIKDGYEEGDPIDIPSDQFVSVRVEMPQDSIWNLAQKAAQEEMGQEQSAEE